MNKKTILTFCVMLTFSLSCLAMKEEKKVYEPEFFKSLVSGPVEDLEKFVDESGDVHAYDSQGKTLLLHAYIQKNSEYMETLTSKGASFDKFLYTRGRYESILEGMCGCDMPEDVRWEAVEDLVTNKCVDPNNLFEGEEAPLEYVVRTKMDKKYVSLLIEAGARVDRVSNLKLPPLAWAIEKRLHDHAHILLKAGAPADSFRWSKEQTPLGSAYLNRDLEMIKILLQAGANPNKRVWGVELPIEYVIREKMDVEYLALLIKAGARVNSVPKGNPNALGWAIQHTLHTHAELLLKAGADANNSGIISEPPLDIAYVYNDLTMMEILLRYGAHPNRVLKTGTFQTYLGKAIVGGDISMINLFLKYGADPNMPMTNDGGVPLAYCILRNDEHMATALLQAGAKPNRLYQSDKEASPVSLVSLAIIMKSKVLKLLLEYGAHVNCKDEKGNTPLHHAAKMERPDACRLLLEYGALKTIRNNKGKKPLHCAPRSLRHVFKGKLTRVLPDYTSYKG